MLCEFPTRPEAITQAGHFVPRLISGTAALVADSSLSLAHLSNHTGRSVGCRSRSGSLRPWRRGGMAGGGTGAAGDEAVDNQCARASKLAM